MSRYHHGNLREALLAEAVDLARAGGPAAIGLREAQRRLGVSPTAAYRHYRGRPELLAAVADHALSLLAEDMQRRIAAVVPRRTAALTARARFRATGEAYLRFALDEPGLFRTAFATVEEPGGADASVAELGLDQVGPFEIVGRSLDDLHAAGGMRSRQRPWTDITAWASVHGLATLLLDGPLRSLPPADQQAAVQRLLDIVERGVR